MNAVSTVPASAVDGTPMLARAGVVELRPFLDVGYAF